MPEADAEEGPEQEQQNEDDSRLGQENRFYRHARDVHRYGPTDGCSGCKFAMVQVSLQCGYTPSCKSRLMKIMLEDKGYHHRVRSWTDPKSIVKSEFGPQAPRSFTTKRNETERLDGQGEPEGDHRRQNIEGSSGSRDVHPQSQNSMAVESNASSGLQVKNGEVGENIDDACEQKRRRMMCLNLAGSVFEKSSQAKMVEAFNLDNVMFVVSNVDEGTTNHVCRMQQERMRNFVHVDSYITTKSAHVIAQLRTGGMVERGIGKTRNYT